MLLSCSIYIPIKSMWPSGIIVFNFSRGGRTLNVDLQTVLVYLNLCKSHKFIRIVTPTIPQSCSTFYFYFKTKDKKRIPAKYQKVQSVIPTQVLLNMTERGSMDGSG